MSNEEQNQNKLLIIWIDKNIKNEENQKYVKDLNSDNNSQLNNGINTNEKVLNFRKNLSDLKKDVQEFTDLNNAFDAIKEIRFIETIIIVSGSYLVEFIKKFKHNLNQIYIIPKIIVFTGRNRQFEAEVLQDKFYSGLIITLYSKLKSIITFYKEKNNKLITGNTQLTNNQYTENINIFMPIKTMDDLKLPKYYKDLVDNFEIKNNPNFILEMFNNYKNVPKYNYLLNQMVLFYETQEKHYIPDIPIELLTKYYARLYSIDGDLKKKMTNELLTVNYTRNNTIYQSYIKTMYEGINKNFFKTCLGSKLYGSIMLSGSEIQELFSYKENFLKDSKELAKDLPKPVIFSKTFISFHKDINEAKKKYFNLRRNTMLVLNTSNKEDFDFKTHADIEEFSINPYEKLVLFFPFSAFGIENFQYNPIEKQYNIELVYFDKLDKKFKMINNQDNSCKGCCLFF